MKKNYLILGLALLCLHVSAQTVLIDDTTLGGIGTSTFQETPIDPDDDYSYTQSIYLQSEINQAGTISKITFFTNGNELLNSNDVVIYMAEKTEDVFASTSDWTALANLTQVYSGTYEVFGNMVAIELDTPFSYSNSANLVIAVDENTDDDDNGGSDFINHNLGFSTGQGRVLHYGGATNEDPATPPTGFLDYYRANIELDFTPITCYAPSGLIASNMAETTADISWTSSDSAWDYVVQVAGTGNPDVGSIQDATTTTANLTGLAGNTLYEIYVRTDCGGGDTSNWIGPVFFRTACAAVIDDFSENFDTMEDDLVTPYCWNTIITTTGTDNPSAYVDSNFTTPEDKYYYMSADVEDTVMLISPNSSVISDGTRRVEFIAEINSDADATPLLVGTMSDPMDDTTFTELRSYVLTEEFANYFVNIPLGTDNYLAFKHGTNTSANRTILVDDIVVTTQPDCLEVYDPVVSNITSSGADLSWTVDGQQTQTEWEYVVQPIGTGNPDAGTMQSANSNPTTISGLNPNMDYEVYVRANCDATGSDGSGVSGWAGPVNFRTGCSLPIDDFSENFDTMPDELEVPYCWSVISETSGTAASTKVDFSSSQSYSPGNHYNVNMNDDDTFYLVAPQSTIISDGMHRVEFAAKVNSTTGGDSMINVGVMSDPNDDTTFVELQSFVITSSSDNTANYSLFYVNVPFSTTHQNLAFKYETESTSNKTFYLDSILVNTQPSCFDVLDLEVSNITDASFDVTFTPDYQTQTEWELVVKQTDLNFNPALETPIVTNSTSVNVTTDSDAQAILPNAPYRLFIRANCEAAASDGSAQSEWFGPIDIVTDCASFVMEDLSFPEMFEASNNDDIIPCWSAIVSEGTGYVRYSTIQENDGASSVRLFYPTSTPTSAYQILISPAFSDLSTDKQAKIWVYDDNNSTLSVGTMTNATDSNTFTEIQRFNNGVDDDFETPGSDTTDDIPDDTWTELTIDFTDHNGTDQYIAFRMLRRPSFASMYLDTFTYQINPSLGTNDFMFENAIKVYPNPANHVLNIQGKNIIKAEVFSINGKKIDLEFNNSHLDVTNLANGMYFVKLTSSNQNSVIKKFVKN